MDILHSDLYLSLFFTILRNATVGDRDCGGENLARIFLDNLGSILAGSARS
jgi:hypothetical protein